MGHINKSFIVILLLALWRMLVLNKKFSEKTVQMAKPFTIEPVTKELKNIYEEILEN